MWPDQRRRWAVTAEGDRILANGRPVLEAAVVHGDSGRQLPTVCAPLTLPTVYTQPHVFRTLFYT